MGEAKILDACRIPGVNAAAKTDSDTLKKQSAVGFAEMMGQSLMQQTKSQTMSDFAERKTELDVKSSSAEFERCRYRDSTVPPKASDVIGKDENVIQEKADEFAENVNQVLTDELGVTEEDIQKAMEALGIGYPDLMNQGNLASLVALLTGSDSVNQLLCSESFVNIMQEVSAISQNLLNTLQMSGAEFKQAVETLDEVGLDTGELITADSKTPEALQKDLTAGHTEVKTAVQSAVLTSDESGKAKESVLVTEAGQQSVEESQEEVSAVIQPESAEEASEEETADQNAGASKEETENTRAKTTNHETADGQSGIAASRNGFLEKLSGVETVQELPEYVSVREIIEQFVERARVTLTDDLSKMEMQLNPANLGKLYLEVTQQEGAVTAKIQAQNAVVKEALEAQLVELKQNMEQAGIRVDSVEVTVASHEFERNLEQDAKRQEQQAKEQEKSLKQHRLFRSSLDGLTGLMSEEELLAARIMAENGNSVDVTA